MRTRAYNYGPMTEEAYFAWDDGTSKKAELFDGVLVVPPQPDLEHQLMSRLLANALDAAGRPVRLRVLQDIAVRLRPQRITVPDISLIPRGPLAGNCVEANVVWLVVEIVSPGNARNDRVRKMNYYAEAGIPSYLMVERRPELSLHLYVLDGDKYVEAAAAVTGELLRITQPFRLDLDPAILIDDAWETK